MEDFHIKKQMFVRINSTLSFLWYGKHDTA